MESELIRKARSFAESVFSDRSFQNRPFHNLAHTLSVVAAAEQIGNRIDLTEDEMESAIIASWLHDIGYIDGESDHEKKAAEKSKELLMTWGAPHRKVLEVTEAILSTKVPQQPKSIVSKVVCDADLFHLSTDQCTEQSDKLRDEWERVGKRSLSDEEWLQQNLEFLENHRYQTPYGQTILQEGKKRNIKKIRKLLMPEISEKNITNSKMSW